MAGPGVDVELFAPRLRARDRFRALPAVNVGAGSLPVSRRIVTQPEILISVKPGRFGFFFIVNVTNLFVFATWTR